MKTLQKISIIILMLISTGVVAQTGTWVPLGTGTNSPITCLAVNETGVYVGGGFLTAGGDTVNRVAKWDGNSWSALGTGINGTLTCIAVNGNDVYVGGLFSQAGGVPASRIAKWDGSSWSALGAGLNNFPTTIKIRGNEIFVGGFFTQAGGNPANRIAKWDGTNWSSIGGGVSGGTAPIVYDIAFDGNDMIIGGRFLLAEGDTVRNIAKWNGTNWSAVGPGFNSNVACLEVSGNDIYAGGTYTLIGIDTIKYMAKWNGSSWSGLGTGIQGSAVTGLSINGSDVYASGQFIIAGGDTVNNIAKWDGTNWSPLGVGVNNVADRVVYYNNNIYAAGSLTMAGGNPANYIAKYIMIPPAPGNLTLNIPLQGTVELNWVDTLSNEDGYVIERRINSDTSWTVMDTTAINATSFIDSGLVVGNTYYYRVYGFNISGNSEYSDTVSTIITAVTVAENTPEKYALYNNYPNPFNPSTKIKFDIPKSGIVKLVIYDILGREVSRLVNNDLNAGRYEMEWNAVGFASGMYFYRIEAEGFIEVKKMMLVK